MNWSGILTWWGPEEKIVHRGMAESFGKFLPILAGQQLMANL